LTPNETEARILLGLAPDDPTPTRDLAGRLLKLGVQQVVVTRGQAGALIVTPDGLAEVPIVEVQAVDVTGAGDSFNASLAVSLAQGMSLRDAVGEAIYAGAYAVTRLGVMDGLPTRAELDNFKQNLTR
jgi:ribokinase